MNTQQMAKEIHSAIVPLIAKIYWSVSLASGGITSLRMKEDKKEKNPAEYVRCVFQGKGEKENEGREYEKEGREKRQEVEQMEFRDVSFPPGALDHETR